MKRRLFLAIGILALCLPLVLADNTAYFPHSIGDFDGTNDDLTRGGGLTGASDGKEGLVSFWFRLDGGDGTYQYLLDSTSSTCTVIRFNNNKLVILLKKVGGVRVLEQYSTSTYTADSTWHNALFSWSLANAKAYIYVDDASVGDTPAILIDDTIDYTVSNWAVAGSVPGAFPFNGALSEFYFALEYLDISIESNRRLFIDRSGNPVFLGVDGSLPTGTAPIIYMRERVKNGGINSGTGGDFTINGAPLYSDGPVPFIPFAAMTPGRGMGSRMRIH